MEPMKFWSLSQLSLMVLAMRGTPSRNSLLTCNRNFSCSKAKDRIFYTPIFSLQEGLKITIDSYSHLRDDLAKREGPSKSYLLLGSGKAADTLCNNIFLVCPWLSTFKIIWLFN
ncbi:hypothetical protein MKX03_037199 [Papaver bracteatum]|nr:hypothetical protein MKX03_037199 [Papaver bracteatum]